jgi:undecaprenyl diphosphate synthase
VSQDDTMENAARAPVHLGIIMDGNGRWAKARGLPRTEGHKEGLKTAKRIVKAAEDAGVRYLSLYTFSTENWRRTSDEVSFLMGMLKTRLAAEFDFYRENGVRILHSGNPEGLPPEVLEAIRGVVRDTAGFKGITVNLAINYGGRDEIIRAIKTIAHCDEPVDEAFVRAHMDAPELPDPDLIIRTGGERRLSNFLLWQAAYAELYFTDTLWPDFGEERLREALDDYARRERRFGGNA